MTFDHCPEPSRELRSSAAELTARLLDPAGPESNDPVRMLQLRFDFEAAWEPYAAQLVAAARRMPRREGAWPRIAEALGMERESAIRKYGQAVKDLAE